MSKSGGIMIARPQTSVNPTSMPTKRPLRISMFFHKQEQDYETLGSQANFFNLISLFYFLQKSTDFQGQYFRAIFTSIKNYFRSFWYFIR